MKKLTYIAVIALVAVFGTTSCNKWFEGVNDNPNEPLDVPVSVILPASQASIAYGVGGDVSRYMGCWMQHYTGQARQFTAIQNYQLTENDVDNFWRFQLYGGSLNDLYLLNEKAEAEGYPEYSGIAKIMMAYGLGVATDLFGDIPYTEAFQGADNLSPGYDNQENLYTAIQGLLDAGIAELGTTGPVAPGADDLIYGGDPALWIQAANALKARMFLHLGGVDAANYTNALNVIDNQPVFTSNADDLTYNFGSSETSANPWYQFNDQRGDIIFSGNLMTLMTTIGDPRFATYFDTTGGVMGMGSFYGSINSPVELVTYVELKFIEAEAALATGDPLRAANAHNDAILASLSKNGVSDATFEAAEATETAATITLEKIMTHKYIALYTSPEVWTDWRRTGFPTLTAVPGNVTGGNIPTRFPYPQSENLYNPNMPTGLSITSQVWWDQ